MIIVTGSRRCGTSLMMQTLKIMGVEPVGVEFDPFWDNRAGDRYRQANPKGYYEVEFQQIMHVDYEGNNKAMKVVGPEILRVNAHLVYGLIWCKRNLHDHVKSILCYPELFNVDNDSVQDIKHAYHFDQALVDEVIKFHNLRYLEVWFENIVSQPEVEIPKIAEFLGLTDNIDIAITNVDKR